MKNHHKEADNVDSNKLNVKHRDGDEVEQLSTEFMNFSEHDASRALLSDLYSAFSSTFP
jgi:hypothetical protein